MKKSSFVPLLIVSMILLVFAVLRFISDNGHQVKETQPVTPTSPISQVKDVKDPAPMVAAKVKANTEGVLGEPDSVRVKPQATESASQEVVEFRKVTRQLVSSLPTIEKVREKARRENSDNHDTPQMVIDAGEGQAQVIETIRRKPQLIAEGVSFFRECAEKDGVMPAVRAVCLRNFRVWATKGNLSTSINVPEYVSNLATSLPAE